MEKTYSTNYNTHLNRHKWRLVAKHYVQLKNNINMKTEKISDVLQGMDVNTEDAIVTLSDKVWEIGELSENV